MEGPHIDLAYLERFCKGDRARMGKYIRLYLEGAPSLFRALPASLKAGDGPGLAMAAHSLRTQVNLMGAQRLFELLTAIEEKAHAEGSAACANQVAEAMALSEQVMEELQAALTRV